MINNIGIDTLSAIIEELNQHIKEAPERKGRYYVQRNIIKGRTKLENTYIAGDGANWIKTGLGIINKSKYVLDHYHLSKYVKILTAHLQSLEEPIDIDKPSWKNLRKGNKKQERNKKPT